jgi:hypothetical protein
VTHLEPCGISRYPVDFASAAFHLRMLRNREKYARFFDVLKVAAPGKVVLDVGAGSGVLSVLAVASGAERVIAVERPTVARFASELLSLFPQWASRIDLVTQDFFAFSPRGKFDLLVAELIGYLGFEEDLEAVVRRSRALCPACIVIPSAIHVLLYPTVATGTPPLQIDFDPWCGFPVDLISQSIPSVAGQDNGTTSGGWSRWQTRDSFAFNAIGVAVTAELMAGVEVTNWQSTVWPRAVFSLGEWITLSSGVTLDARLTLVRESQNFAGQLALSVGGNEVRRCDFHSSDLILHDGRDLRSNANSADVVHAAAEVIASLTDNLD